MENSFSTVEDVIADEGFQSWYSGSDKAAVNKWEQKIAREPALASLVQEATVYMQALAVRERAVPESQVAAAEQRLMTTLSRMTETTAAPVIGLKRGISRWWWAAAAVLIIAVSGVALWNQQRLQPTSVHTTFGEIREQQLPDGSKVMLNANSEISYHEGASREVWLKGEAFFHVAKTPGKARFIVHADQFDVVVTGTQFNVMNREGKTNVMLTEGSVILKTRQGKDIYMKPGDFVEFNAQEPAIKVAKEEKVLAWKEKKLYFENTPLSIAVQNIEELYGVTIRLANKKIGEKPITGIMSNDNLDILLQALEATTEFHVVRKNDEILITE
jgi:ferric-dicitrate binding protein FerR (iron transport regulator)